MANINEFEKRYQEEQKKKKETTISSSNNLNEFEARYRAEQASSILEQNPTIIEDFNTRMKNFTEQYNSFFNTYRRKDFARNTANSLETEANELKKLLNEYGILFDDDYVSETTEFLNSARPNLNDGVDHWSQWATRDDYDTSVRMNGYYTKYQGMTPEDEAKTLEDLQLRYTAASTAGSKEAKLLQEEIDYLYNYGSQETQIAGRKKQYANNSAEIENLNAELKPLEEQAIALFNEIEHTLDLDKVAELQKQRNDILASYNEIKAQRDALVAENTRYERGEGVTDKVYTEYKYVTEKPDYAEHSKAGESKIGGFLGLGGDDKYDYINDINGLRIQRSANAMRGGGGNPYKIYDHMTEDEIGVYNYLYSTEGKDSANDYLKKLESALDVRSTDANTELQQKLVKENPWYATVMNIGSVITKPFGDAAAFVDNTINQFQGEDINPYSQWQTMRNTNNAVREATTQVIEANTDWEFLDQNVWGQVYNAGMSTLDSLYGVAMFGNGYSFIASSGAAANKAAELYEKGATSDQIFWGGTAAGLAEFVFEKVSIDNLIKAKNPDSVFKVIAEALKQAGIEGSEEIATEIANTITDTVIMGSQSDLSLAVKAYQDEGLSYEEAYKKALQDKATDVIWAGISGMLSGGVSGGITTTHQGISNAVAGKGIKKQGDTEAMIMAGVDAQQGSQAYKLAEKAFRDYTEGDALYRLAEKMTGAKSNVVQKLATKATQKLSDKHGKGNVSSMRLGALKQTTMEDVVDQYRNRETLSESDIQAKLESRGIDSKKAAEFASVVAKVANGKKLSERETAILNDNIDVKDVAEEVSSGQVVDNIAANIKLNKIGSLGKEKVAETPDTYSVSEAEGKTLLKDSGAEVNIVDIASIDNGNMMLKVNDGTEVKEVNAENISFASNEEAVMYEMVASMDIDAASARAIIGNFDAKSGITAGQYILGAQEAFTYGKYNFAPEEMSKIGFSADLTQTQKTFAYNLGKNMHITNVAAQESAVKKAVDEAKTDNEVQGGKKGNVIYESGKTALTDRQEASVKSLEVIAKALGIDIYLYESTLDDKGRRAYIDKDGKRITANGYYDPKTGDIHIDINAGENGEGVMLFTAAHELTHFVRQWSPAKFKVLADFLMAEYGKAGVPVAELVRYQQNLASKQGRKISYDTAYEEMIADSMQTMLSDGAVVEKLAKLANKDKTLVEKMKELMDGLVEKIKSVYSEMTPYSKAGRYASMLNEAERLQGLFYDALVSAGENYRGAGGKMNTADAEMKLMARELGNDLGTIERTDNGDIALITNKDNSLLLYSARTYEDGGREKLEATLKANGHTQEEINDTLKLVDDAADYLRILAAGYAKRNYGKFGERLSEHLEATVTTDLKGHKQVLSTLVNNGDYPVNLDLALICKKRVAYMRLMTRLIEDGVFGDVVYGGDAIAEVNAILREDGFETACLGCFVESRRLQFQTWAETIVQEWNEAVDAHTKNAGYFGFAKGGKGNLTEDDMDAMEAELKGQKKNDKGNVNLGQGSAVTRMNRLLDKMPSLAKKLTVDDLLTPQGLTTLRQADGNLFSIVKSRYGAASPKIVQEFSPYASEIANLTFSYVKKMTGESISGGQGYIRDAQKELAAEKPVKVKGESKEDFKARKKVWDDKVETLAMNNYLFAIGGARIQSFSDFMIENVFDYIQIMADLAAKGSPLHGYTKEIACLRLFGMTGAKWNGSLIAHVDRSMGKEMAGLLPASEAKNGNAILVHTPKGDYAIGFDDYARHIATNKKSFIQSIGMKDIVALMLDPRYSANVGNITIGVSDMQILAMLDSPLFRMVIPYHASGMLPQFAQLVGVDNYNDYTDYQNTTVKQYFDLEGNPIKELKKANGKDLLKPDMSYKYNEKVQELAKKGVKDAPRQAANDYIEWCGKMHPVYDGKKRVGYATLKPKFSDSPYGTDFSKHKNYYKLLEDFNMYDNNTEAVALQEAVKMVLPSEANRLNAEQMEAYKQALRDAGIFTEAEISKYAKKADMTFEEIIKAEMDNRQAYEEETDPKWDTTVKKVEDHLKKHHPRNGQAKSAEDYADAKGKSAISRIKAVDGSYAIQIADNEIKLSARFDEHSVETALWDAMSHKDEGYDNLILVSAMPDYIVDKLGIEGDFYIYRDHAYENMVSKEEAEEAGRPTKRGKENIHFHNFGIEKMTRAILSINNPIMTISTKTKDGNPAVIMMLDEYGTNKAPLYAVLSFYANKGINGDWSQRPHIVLTIAERNYTEKDGGRVGYDEIIKNAIKDGRVLDFDEKKRDDLSVIANTAGIGNITKSSLDRNITYFKKEVKAFKEKNNILYSERDPNSVSNRSLLANALENAATNDFEREKLAKYKEKISSINAEERKLADLHRQLKELRFSKGKRDAAKAKKIRDLQDEATKTANRISIYDKQLLGLEASKPLRDILEREKVKAAKRQKQRDAEILQEQKDKANATIREIMNRNTESRKRAVEGRHKTVVRNKIKRAIKDLNSVFNKGTKERNVKIGLRDTVRKALEASEVLFSEEITNEDIVRLGVDSVSAEEQAKLERYSELLLGIEMAKKKNTELSQSQDFKKDSIFAKDIAYKINENNKRIVSMKNQISKLNKELESVFIRERARLNKENVSSALDSLAEAYASLQNSDDDYIKNNAFVQGMHDRIKSLSENLNGVTIKDMSLEQLEEVYKMYSSVKHMIVNANSIFRDGLREDLSKKIMTVQGEILELQKDNRKDPRAVIDAINNAIKSFDWNNQKPVYAFEKLGSQAFQELFWDAVKAEGVYAQDVVEAGEFLDEQKDKFKYADWDFKKAQTFKSANGLDFKLTLSDMMSIYAYSKRPQAFDHMTQGGFTFDRGSVYVDEKGRKRKHVRLSETYTVSIELINEIVKTLSEEQIGYVDAVQAYLTSLGEKGNEISRTLYGIDLFTEQVYFPLKSDADYRSSVEQALNETQTQVSLKNTGMSKQTVPHANNPIVLQGFDDVVLGHIDNMSKYHSFVLPIENLRRVFDNVSRDENAGYDATKVIIESVFGESAKQYFDQYITDLNGGVYIGGYQNIFMDMFSKMKKTAVSASLSVVVQQPFAIVRAMDRINPVYFAPVNFNAAKKTDAKTQWEEIKRYAPIAIIKEMGGFDVGTSRTTKDYIGGANYKGWGKVKGFFKDSDYRKTSLDDLFMWGASKADEIGWSTIWKAVKKEVASQHKELAVGSEEFLQKCGERFTEVVVYTQVYDSVNSRSGMMRSKKDLDKFATSFMGEPTTTINMIENSMLKFARSVKSKKGVAKASAAMGRTIGVTLGSILLTSLAKSLVYAGRDDDDEDKALLERWAKHFGDSLTNDLNPLTMIPYLRDFVSIWEGWDTERPDMTIVADIVTSIKKAVDEGCTLEEALALIGNAGNAFGIPVKNIIREVQGTINTFNDFIDDIKPTDIGGAFVEGWTGEEKSTKDSLYQALVSGDESRIAILKAEYKTEDAYEQAIRKGLRENDPRIKEAAQARIDGNISEYSSIVREIKAEGHFSQDTIVAAVNAEINLINKEAKDQNAGSNDVEDTEEEKATSIYKASDVNTAFDNGDTNMALTIIEDLVETKVANGMTEKEAKSSVKSSITSYWKPIFLEAYSNKDSAEQKRIRQILLSSGLYGRTSEVIDTTQQWIKDSKKTK